MSRRIVFLSGVCSTRVSDEKTHRELRGRPARRANEPAANTFQYLYWYW